MNTVIEGKNKQLSARQIALDVLVRVDRDGSYSNLLLHQTLQKHELSRPDAALATELVYGTIQRLNTIDYFLGQFVKQGLRKLEPWVKCLLRLSFYQLYYLERIPEHAAVNEAVNIAKKKGHQGISGMVNGVLRNVIRQKSSLTIPERLAPAARIALLHSHPEWLVARWIKQYGIGATERMCAAANVPPHVSIRMNRLKSDRTELIAELAEEGIDAVSSALAPAGIVVTNAGNMALNPKFGAGVFSIQDESSMLVAELVDPQPGMRVLDCCAAPGGKTAHMAEKMDDRGEIIACDIHEHKQALIEAQAKRLGLKSIRTIVQDARELAGRFPEGSFDRVLLDAPCSGLGVIRRKPEIKWTKQAEDITAVSAVQRELLEQVKRLVKPGGVLVYSTCTVERSENDRMIEAFLQDNPDFRLDADPGGPAGALRQKLEQTPVADAEGSAAVLPMGMVQILPQQFGTDGFFIARLIRV